MKLAFAVNDPLEISSASTTLALIRSAHARGHDVFVFGVDGVSVDDGGRPYARGYAFDASGPVPPVTPQGHPTQRRGLEDHDAIAIRTSPGRDIGRGFAHEGLLRWTELVADAPTFVFNDPTALRRAGTKDFLAQLPIGTRPEMLVSRDVDEILSFLGEREIAAVVKPLLGTRGTDVYRIDPSQLDNARMIVQSVVRNDFALVQDYVREAPQGDTRVVMVEGRVLDVDGELAAVRRVPQPGEFRSNVHLGATPQPADLNAAQLETLEAIGPVLRQHDMFLVGVDLVGDQVIELNVYATGGLTDAGQFTGKDFVSEVIARLEARVE